MVWCRQATSHYVSQCWPRSLSPYGVTRPQWVNCEYFLEKMFSVMMGLCCTPPFCFPNFRFVHGISILPSAYNGTLHGSETDVFRGNKDNTMVADALALCITRPSIAMILTMQDIHIFVFHWEGFQIHAPCQYWEMMENINIFYVSWD